MSKLKITVLVENTVRKRTLLAEHGLSLWIEVGDKKILSDTGHTNIAIHNARELGINLCKADAVILSHGHSDHTGGLENILNAAPDAQIFTHKKSFENKFSKQTDGTINNISLPISLEAITAYPNKVILNDGTKEIFPGIHFTGTIPRETEIEDTGGNFFHDCACTVTDPILDDQVLFIDTPKGLVVVLGCAHSGIINTLNYIQKLTNNKQIHTVIGGMHLIHASQDRINWTISELAKLNVKQLFPNHCTGFEATASMYTAFPEQCKQASVGTVITI